MEEVLVSNIPENVAEVGVAASPELTSLITENLLTTNNLWMMTATFLVFIMHLGFAGVEAGFTQSKNTVNILFKNTLTPAIGLITFAFIGFNLMLLSHLYMRD